MPIKAKFRVLESKGEFFTDNYFNLKINCNYNFKLVNFNSSSNLVQIGLCWLPAPNSKSTVSATSMS